MNSSICFACGFCLSQTSSKAKVTYIMSKPTSKRPIEPPILESLTANSHVLYMVCFIDPAIINHLGNKTAHEFDTIHPEFKQTMSHNHFEQRVHCNPSEIQYDVRNLRPKGPLRATSRQTILTNFFSEQTRRSIHLTMWLHTCVFASSSLCSLPHVYN